MIKKLSFIEQYIDEKPLEKYYWRGINAICDGINMFNIHYYEKENKFDDESYFHIRPTFLPTYILSDDNTIIFPELNKTYSSKEDVKEAAQTLFEKYINLFITK